MDCDCSGVIGAAESTARDSFIAWVQEVNARGGIAGHQVKFVYADDNNSASQDLQNVEQFVQGDHVIALVNLFPASGGIDSVAQYAQQKGIPVVGGDGYEPEWNQYPGMFSTATSDEAQDYSWAYEMKAAGKTVVGAIYCAEGQICTSKEQEWKTLATQIGLQVKFESKESLASPSFSNDCLIAKSDGVQAIVPIMDGASAARIARDCNQQAYDPLLIDSQPFNDPPNYMNGVVAPLASFPWFLTSGSPAITDYAQALNRYDHNPLNAYSALGWANAKLLEAALSTHLSATPTPQDVFNGLYALTGSTLGGLTAPLNYPAGKPHPPIKCSFRAVAHNGNWTAPNGMSLVDCQP